MYIYIYVFYACICIRVYIYIYIHVCVSTWEYNLVSYVSFLQNLAVFETLNPFAAQAHTLSGERRCEIIGPAENQW